MKIYQLTNSTAYQMMGYVIQSDNGKVIVIDGGHNGDGVELERIIKLAGGHVDMWFITHPHADHYNAAMEVIGNNSISVDGIWRNYLPNEWGMQFSKEYDELAGWNEFEKTLNIPLHELVLGDKFVVDNVNVYVLGVAHPEITVNSFNNQSCVLKIEDEDFSLLILGDLGIESGEILLNNYPKEIKCDAVQMAHHGQQGVSRNLYEAIGSKYAFWPTPKWLWDNTEYLGGTPGSGNFKTPEVVKWMKTLNTINITSFEYTILFNTKTKLTERV